MRELVRERHARREGRARRAPAAVAGSELSDGGAPLWCGGGRVRPARDRALHARVAPRDRLALRLRDRRCPRRVIRARPRAQPAGHAAVAARWRLLQHQLARVRLLVAIALLARRHRRRARHTQVGDASPRFLRAGAATLAAAAPPLARQRVLPRPRQAAVGRPCHPRHLARESGAGGALAIANMTRPLQIVLTWPRMPHLGVRGLRLHAKRALRRAREGGIAVHGHLALHLEVGAWPDDRRRRSRSQVGRARRAAGDGHGRASSP